MPFYQSPGAVSPGDLGKLATGFINTNLTVTGFNDYANDGATILVRGENNHGVAKALVDFMNQEGLVSENGRYVRDQVYDPLFVFGLPVTSAYWVKTKVGGGVPRHECRRTAARVTIKATVVRDGHPHLIRTRQWCPAMWCFSPSAT